MNFALFGRFFLEFAMMYPAEYLCLASLQEHLRAPRKTYAIGASAITLMGLAGAAVCCMLDMETNFLLIPLLINQLLAAALAHRPGSIDQPDHVSVLGVGSDDVCVHPACHCAERGS